MADPLDKAVSRAPATLGEGCLSRYDPDDLSPEDGTEFPGAAELWEQLRDDSDDLSGLLELHQLPQQWPPEHQ
ncbi:MAG TPA: hypothetical protein VJ889_10865 [Pseudomonas sp.]|nr:hypothetical protein [Pseudomonas sp.]